MHTRRFFVIWRRKEPMGRSRERGKSVNTTLAYADNSGTLGYLKLIESEWKTFCRWKHVIVECGTGPSVIILDPIHSNQRPGRLAIYACWSSIASAAEWRTIGPFLVHFRCQELCKIVSSCRRRCESARTHLKPSLAHSVWQNRLLLMYTVAIWYIGC